MLFAKLKDVTGDVMAEVTAVTVALGASDVFTRLIGEAVTGGLIDCSLTFGVPRDENTKLVAGDAIDVIGLVVAGVESNALTMLGDSVAIETFSVVSFATGAVDWAPKIGIELAACPKIVSGFCTGMVALLVDFGAASGS